MMPLEFKTLASNELDRVLEIDRSEHVSQMYRAAGGELEAYDDSQELDSNEAFWNQHLPEWKEEVDAGALAFGSFDGDRMAGVAIVKPNALPGIHRILALYVSAEYRLSGIAKSLYMEMEKAARNGGAKSLFVSTSPTGPAVNFYLSQGFHLAPQSEDFPPGYTPDAIPMLKAL